MSTRKSRNRIIDLNDVDRIFNSEKMQSLMKTAKIDPLYENQFVDGLHRSIRSYLEMAKRLDRGEIRDAISELGQCIFQALLSNRDEDIERAAVTFSKLPIEATEILERLASGTRALKTAKGEAARARWHKQLRMNNRPDRVMPLGASRIFPTPNEIRDPRTSHDALNFLYGICTMGVSVVPGRKRPGGRRSRSTLRVEYVPGARVRFSKKRPFKPVREPRGRTTNAAEILFCALVGQLYFELTGREPRRWRLDRKIGTRGPFVALMTEIVPLIGAGVSAERLVRTYGEPPKP